MLTRKNGTKLIKPIPFSELEFRVPYTEKWLCDGQTTVFFSDVAKKSGVVVEQYNFSRKLFLRLGSAQTDMYSNALILQKYAKKIGATDLKYAFIPCHPKKIPEVRQAIWMGFLNHQTYHAFDVLHPWFENGSKDDFPQSLLDFHEPFFFSPQGERRWALYDLKQRSGLYLVAEDGIIVRAGQARDLAQRPRAYFYPLSEDKSRTGSHYKVSYHDRLVKKEHVYTIAPIPFPIAHFKSWEKLYRAIDFFEKKLNTRLKPRDNRKGLDISEEGLPF